MLNFFADALEAVKQGGATVGCKVRNARCSYMRSEVKLAGYWIGERLTVYHPLKRWQNADYVVLVTLKRAAAELSHHQQKIFKVDKNMGIAISGLTADGNLLSKYLRNECINHRFVYDSSLTVGRIATLVADKSQVCSHSFRCKGVHKDLQPVYILCRFAHSDTLSGRMVLVCL